MSPPPEERYSTENRSSSSGSQRWHYVLLPPQVLKVIARVWSLEVLRLPPLMGEGVVSKGLGIHSWCISPHFSQTLANSHKKVQSSLCCVWKIKGKKQSVVQKSCLILPSLGQLCPVVSVLRVIGSQSCWHSCNGTCSQPCISEAWSPSMYRVKFLLLSHQHGTISKDLTNRVNSRESLDC